MMRPSIIVFLAVKSLLVDASFPKWLIESTSREIPTRPYTNSWEIPTRPYTNSWNNSPRRLNPPHTDNGGVPDRWEGNFTGGSTRDHVPDRDENSGYQSWNLYDSSRQPGLQQGRQENSSNPHWNLKDSTRRPGIPQGITSHQVPESPSWNQYNATKQTGPSLPNANREAHPNRPTFQNSSEGAFQQRASRDRSCGLIPNSGECLASIPKYFYNESTSQCDCYLFGGCDESPGSYRSLEECHRRCLPVRKDEGRKCNYVSITNFNPINSSTSSSTTHTPIYPVGYFTWPLISNQSSFPGKQSVNDSGVPNNTSSSNSSSGYQNHSTAWSQFTTKFTIPPTVPVRVQSPKKEWEPHGEIVHYYCAVFLRQGNCDNSSPRYYYNRTASRCDCYSYNVCDDKEESFHSLKECHQKCEPYLKEEGPTCQLLHGGN